MPLTNITRRRSRRPTIPRMLPAREDIFDLFERVRAHPDFVFGTIFVLEDFARGAVPAGFSPRWATDALAERGNQMIGDAGATPLDDADNDLPCLLRVYPGGSEYVTFADFAEHVVQEHDAAEEIVSTLLRTGEPYVYNEDEPEFREVFTITDERGLRDQLAATERDAVGGK